MCIRSSLGSEVTARTASTKETCGAGCLVAGLLEFYREEEGRRDGVALDGDALLVGPAGGDGVRPELQAAGRAEADLADQPEVLASVRRTMGVTYSSLGLFESAEPHLRAALDADRRLYGDDAPETARSMHYLALLLQGKGDYAGRSSSTGSRSPSSARRRAGATRN